MANAKEIEIVESLRSQGYTSNQIIGAVRQHRQNIKIKAQQRKQKAEFEEQQKANKQKFREEQSTVGKTYSSEKLPDNKYYLEDGKWVFYNKDNKRIDITDGSVGQELEAKYKDNKTDLVTDYRPVLNEETKEYEWHYLKNGKDEGTVKGEKTLETLNLANPNALNESKYDDFRVVDGEWKKKDEETGEYTDINKEEVSGNLDVLYPNAKPNAAKRKDGQSAKDFTYNLIDVNKGKELKKIEEENEIVQNTSYEEWLEDNRSSSAFILDSDFVGYGMIGEAFSSAVDVFSPTEDGKGDEIKTYRRQEYLDWKKASAETLPSNVQVKISNPDAYIQNNTDKPFLIGNDIVKPGDFYLSPAERKNAETKNLDVDLVINKDKHNGLVLNKNQDKALPEIEKIEEHWGDNYNGDYSVSEIVNIGINRGFGVNDFKEGKYVLDGQTYNVTEDDLSSWKQWKSHNTKHGTKAQKEEEEYLLEVKNKSNKEETETLYKIQDVGNDSSLSEDDKKRKSQMLFERLPDDSDVKKDLQTRAISDYSNWLKVKEEVDKYEKLITKTEDTKRKIVDGKKSMEQYQNKWGKFYSDEEEIKSFIRNKIQNQTETEKLNFSETDMGVIDDTEDFEKWLNVNYKSEVLEELKFDESSGNFIAAQENILSELGITTSTEIEERKATLLQAYLNEKGIPIQELHASYESNGFQDKVDELDKISLSIDVSELDDKTKVYNDFREKIESGEIERTEENVTKLNSMITEINVIQDLQKRKVDRYNKIVNEPSFKLLADGYGDFIDQNTNLKAKYNSLEKNNKFVADQMQQRRKIEVASNHWSAPFIAPVETIFNTVVGGSIDIASYIGIEGADIFLDIDKGRKSKAYALMSGLSEMTNVNMIEMGPLFDPETGEMNYAALADQSAQTLTMMYMMVRGGGVARSSVTGMSKGLVNISKRTGVTSAIARNLPKTYAKLPRFNKAIGKVNSAYKIADRGQQMIGGAMTYHPMNIREAMSQVDDDFTVEDAFTAATTKTMFESGIETLFPDVNMFRAMSKIKSLKAWSNPKMWADKSNITKFLSTLSSTIKQIPKEMIEENLQELASGIVSMEYNRSHDTDFHVPTAEDFKALNILTPITVLLGGAIRSTGFTKGQLDSSVYQAAIENMKEFQEVMKEADLPPGEYSKIMDKVKGYILAKEEIGEEEYNSMTNVQRNDTLNALLEKNQLEAKIKETKDPAEKKRLELDLKNTNANIKKLAGQVDLNFKSKQEEILDYEIAKLKNELYNNKSDLGSKERSDLKKKIADKLTKRNEARQEASPYEFQGKGYDNLSDFIKAIRTAKKNGFFDNEGRGDIKINNKVDADIATTVRGMVNEITGIENFTSEETLMSKSDAMESQEFQSSPENRGKTLADYELELEDVLRENGGMGGRGIKDADEINNLQNTINYLKLKDRGYEFDPKTGLIKTGTSKDGGFDFSSIDESKLEAAVEAVRNITNVSGVTTMSMSIDQMIASNLHVSVAGSLDQIAFMAPVINPQTGLLEPILIINKEKALASKNFTAASHEFLHQVLFSIINGGIKTITKDGVDYETRLTEKGAEMIQGVLDLLTPEQRKELDLVMEQREYFTRDKNGDIIEPFERYAEEYLTNMHDIVNNGITLRDGTEIKWSNRPDTRGVFKKIKDYVSNFFKSNMDEDYHGLIDTNIDTPEKLLEFLRTFNTQAINKKFSTDIENLSIAGKTLFGEVVKPEEAAISFSQFSRNVKKEVDDLITPKEATELANEVNDIYNDDRIADDQKEFMIAAKYRGMAEARWKEAYRQSLGTDSQKVLEEFKEDIISDMLFDLGTETRKARTVVGLVRDFKTEKQKYGNTAAYINTFFKVRAFEVLSKYTKDKGFARSMDDAINEVSQMEDASNELDEAKGIQSGGIVVSERLVEAEKGTDRESRIKQHIVNLNNIINNNPEIAEGKNYKSLPDLDPRGTISMMMSDPTAVYKDDGTPFWKSNKGEKLLGTSILDSIVEKLANNANLNQQDIKALQQYISKHNQLLWTALPQGFTTKRVKQKDGSFIQRADKSTGVQTVLLEPFYNKAAKPFGNFFPQNKKPSMDTNNFLEVFGITPRLEVNIVGKESNVSQRVKALITQHGKIISNQTVRQNESTTDATRNALENGKSLPMFSKAIAGNPKMIAPYLQAVGIMDRTIPWGSFTPTTVTGRLKVKDVTSDSLIILKDKIKTALVEAGVDKNLHADIIKEMLGPTGIIISQQNIRSSYKGNSKSLPPMVDQARTYYELNALTERQVMSVLGMEGTYKSIANQEEVIVRARQRITSEVINAMKIAGMDVSKIELDNKTLLKNVWKSSTAEQKVQVLEHMWKTKGQYAASGKIVDGAWTIEKEGGKPVRNKKHVPNKGRMGMQLTEGIGDWAALINNAIEGIDIIPLKPAMEKGKPKLRTNSHVTRQPSKVDYTKLDKMYPGFNRTEILESSDAVIDKIDAKGNYTNFTKHKNQALGYRSMLANQFISFNNDYHNSNDLTDDRDAATYIMTLSSGMTSPSRKAAYPWGISDGAKDVASKNRGTALEYDHLKPNNVLMLKLANMLKRNLTEAQIKSELDVFFKDFVVNIIPAKMDGVVKMNKSQSHMHLEYREGTDMTDMSKLEESALGRIFHPYNKFNIEMKAITALDPELNGLRIGDDFVNKVYHNFDSKQQLEQRNIIKLATVASRSINHKTPSRGMSAFDFDETLIDKGDNTIIATKGDETIEITSGQWPLQGPQLAADGYKFDFSDFINVRGGVEGPLMQKFRNRIEKFGIENNYILTARPAEAAPAIQAWLKEQGIDMPIENITGLGNSTGEAKAMWMAQKFSEGYNDMYFVDDAMPNVKAVADMLNELDIKGSSVQAKIQFSRSINPTFNETLDANAGVELDLNRILEQTKGVKAEARYSEAQGKIQGSKKGRFAFWVPPSAEDFKGLIYRFVGKGRQGEAQLAFFKKALFDPFGRGINAMNTSKQQLQGQYQTLLKEFPNVKKDLSKKISSFESDFKVDFKVEQAVRVYLWNKNGMEVPGLSARDLKALVDFVESDAELKEFADNLSLITNQEQGYVQPNDFWLVEGILSDIQKINNELSRTEQLAEFVQNKEEMFGVWENGRIVGPNMNKIEAIYGSNFREALEDILWRMEFGSKREAGTNRLVNTFNNWANQSVGAIMFLNMRSALLQTISSINYLNWSDNNPLKAGLALANFPQFIKDFSMIFNSDMLKQRRAGNQRGVNETELAQAVAGSKNKAKAILNYLLTKGFLPTQIADSFAIASGGATFYRNRVNSLIKQGLSQSEAEARAFQDFAETTEESQQSSRPDMISQQQASPLGRYILAFKNTPMQYARLMKKAFLDIKNGRGDFKTNMGKIIYYGMVQNFIFSALQSALGAMIGDDDEEKETKAYERTINSMIDSILGGIGLGGNIVMTIKNTIMEYNKQEKKGWNSDHTYTILKFFGLSPTVGSKGRKLYSAIQTRKFNKDVMEEMSLLDIDNPAWSVIANLVSAGTNLPLDRLVKKIDNVDAALTEDISAMQRFALLMGWNTWDLGVEDQDIVAIEDQIKEKKKVKKEEQKKINKEEKKKEIELEEKKLIEDNIEKQKTEKGEIKCAAINKAGKRCGTKIEPGQSFCTIHVKVDQGTKEVQCSKVKSDKKRCKMKTKAKSGLCYYHD